MPKEKKPFQKVRRTWKINPKDRIKETKQEHDYNPCKYCNAYKYFTDACYFCDLI